MGIFELSCWQQLASSCSISHAVNNNYPAFGCISLTQVVNHKASFKHCCSHRHRNRNSFFFLKEKHNLRALGATSKEPPTESSSGSETLTSEEEPPTVNFAFVSSVLLPDESPDVRLRTATGGKKLRDIMLDANVELYGPYARPLLNCGGGGTCGTCIVEVVQGRELLNRRTDKEKEKLKRVSLDGDKKADLVRELHTKARLHVEAQTERYKTHADKGKKEVIFEPGDWVWLHLRKNRFPHKRKSKLQPRGDGPFEVLERVNNNAYKIGIPGDWGTGNTFNVADLTPFDNPYDLRSDPSEPGGNDMIHEAVPDPLASLATHDPLIIRDGPMTRLQKRRMREGLDLLVSKVHEECSSTKIGDGPSIEPKKAVICISGLGKAE